MRVARLLSCSGAGQDSVRPFGEVLLVGVAELLMAKDVQGTWHISMRVRGHRAVHAPSRKERMMDDMICPFSSSMMNLRFLSAWNPSYPSAMYSRVICTSDQSELDT